MRHLARLDKPQILIDKQNDWTEKFIDSGKDRPVGNQYNHISVKEKLRQISSGKCFYSEVKFAHISEAQIDHYLEIVEDKTKTFEWENLYLAHKDCNQGKSTNKTIANVETLNPFLDSDEEIEKHLFFEDNSIKSLTDKGFKTIQKYNLDKDIFDKLRGDELNKFNNLLIEIYKISKNRDFTVFEKQCLQIFSQPDSSFSLMFRLILKKHNLL